MTARPPKNGQLTERSGISTGRKPDWLITLLPLATVVLLCLLFFFFPASSNRILDRIRQLVSSALGPYYLIIGLVFFLLSLFLAFSPYGSIVLGRKGEKPKYSFFKWGAMMFTCGLAADILFYSFGEWMLYAADPNIEKLGPVRDWAGVFPFFHWSFIPWSFYLVLAVSFAFMLHVKKNRRKKYSEACRPLLGKYADGWAGRLIDLLAVFSLLAGTATTFSIATPLMASLLDELLGLQLDRNLVTIAILLFTCFVYSYSLLHGIRGISLLADLCIYLFFGLLAFVFLFSGQAMEILKDGLTYLGRMILHFFRLAAYANPLAETSFPQDWTIYYWSYWIVWCVAAPFFIGSISRGRTVRQTILGGYLFGVGSTLISFLILGNYSLHLDFSGKTQFLQNFQKTGDLYATIVHIIQTLPAAPLLIVIILITMLALYATSFDAIALTAASYSYRSLAPEEEPHKGMQLLWCLLLILLPIALVFSGSSMSNLQSVSILSALPLSVIILLIALSFLKEGRKKLPK